MFQLTNFYLSVLLENLSIHERKYTFVPFTRLHILYIYCYFLTTYGYKILFKIIVKYNLFHKPLIIHKSIRFMKLKRIILSNQYIF